MKVFSFLTCLLFWGYLFLLFQAATMCGQDKIGIPVIEKGIFCISATHWTPVGDLGK